MASTQRDHWTSFDSLDGDSYQAKRIERILTSANFSFLCAEAVKLRRGVNAPPEGLGEPATLTCSIDPTVFTNGVFNVVFEVMFSDSVRWIARVRLQDEEESDANVATGMLSEIATIKLVRARTTIPAPEVFGFDVTPKNLFGFRYVLMEALGGHPLDRRFAYSVPKEYLSKLPEQLADYFFQLSSLRFDRIGRLWGGPKGDEAPPIIETPIESSEFVDKSRKAGPLATSLEYFYLLGKAQTRKIHCQHPGDQDWAAAAWILEQSLPSIVVEDHLYGPFPLCHLDMHYNNILVDDNYNICGVIDWSDAQIVPLERFATNPEFITPPLA